MKTPAPNYGIHNKPKKKETQEQACNQARQAFLKEPVNNVYVSSCDFYNRGWNDGVRWAKEAK